MTIGYAEWRAERVSADVHPHRARRSADIYTIAGRWNYGHTAADYSDGVVRHFSRIVLSHHRVRGIIPAILFIGDYYNQRIREVSCVTTTSTGGACTPSTGQTAW